MRRLFAIAAGLWLAAVAGVRAEPGRQPNAELPTPTVAPGGPTIEVAHDTAQGCPSPCAPLCEPPCGPPGRFWVLAEFLYWHANGSNTPPLLTTSPPGTPQQSAGVLGAPGTAVVAGGRGLNDNSFPGLRVGAGVWLDDCRTVGVEGSFFFLFDDNNDRAQLSSPGSPPLSRPFFNASTGRPDAELIAFPGVASGSAVVNSSFALQGANANIRCNLCCFDTPCCDCRPSTGGRLDALFGYRYLRLHEDLVITEDLTAGPAAAVAPGTRFVVRDGFRTENRFNGGQVGLAGRVYRGRLWLDVIGQLGIGSTHQVVSIGGSTTTTAPGQAPITQRGGLLALPSNSGRFADDEFTVVPELTVRLGYQVCGGLRVFVGYDLIYWDHVVRPGEQIDLTVNPTQIPPGSLVGAARPAPTGRDTDLFLQGVTAGFEVRW